MSEYDTTFIDPTPHPSSDDCDPATGSPDSSGQYTAVDFGEHPGDTDVSVYDTADLGTDPTVGDPTQWSADHATTVSYPGADPGISESQIGDSQYWFKQDTNFTCGPASVTQILEDYTGQQFDNEDAVAQYAQDQGWLTDRGMSLDNLDDLLTAWGVPSHVEPAGTDAASAFQKVDQYLSEGRAVVMFVDASEYWQPGSNDNTYHFVRILDVDPERGVAVLSDSGVENGRGLEVPLSTLADAWAEGQEDPNVPNYGMVVSDVTDPTVDSSATGLADGAAAEPGQAIGQGQPFAVLPITMTQAGLDAVAACDAPDPTLTDPTLTGSGYVVAPDSSSGGPTVVVGGDPAGNFPGTSLPAEEPVSTTAQPQSGLTVAVGTPSDEAGFDVTPDLHGFGDDILSANQGHPGSDQQGSRPSAVPGPGLSLATSDDAINNTPANSGVLPPQGYVQDNDPGTGETRYFPE
jgi:hypothetical protein